MRLLMRVIAVMILCSVAAQATAAQAGCRILVSAAASLSDVFREIGAEFMARNPDVKLEFNFAASGALLQQMELGAPVDVFASADMQTMELARERGLVQKDTVAPFASNSIVLVTPAGSRAGTGGTGWLLSRHVVRVALGNPRTVPAGRYAKDALELAGVWGGINEKLVLAENVRQVLDYVRRGEVDAGIVYATDAAIAKDYVRVGARLDSVTPVVYPVAVVNNSGYSAAATRFVNFLEGESAAAILKSYGFNKP